MGVVFTNNALSTLVSSIIPASTTLTVQTADAALFPPIVAGDWFPVTVVEGAKLEIMRCTGRAGPTMTVTRAQEGTAAQSFGAGALVDHRLTKAALQAFLQDPPSDGKLYGRKNAAWADTALPPAVPDNGTSGATDWNTIATPGWYSQLLASAPNGPTAGNFFCLSLLHNALFTQVAYPYAPQASLGVWMRGQTGPGAWGAWSQLGASAAPPVGEIIYVPGNVAPANYLKSNGALLSRAAYPALWAYAQVSGALFTDAQWMTDKCAGFSSGTDGTNFRIPDDRGTFTRGWDDGRGLDAGRPIGTYQIDAYLNHDHTGVAMGTHQHTTVTTFQATGGSGTAVARTTTGITSTGVAGATNPVSAGTPNINVSTTGDTETRGKNNARLACIRYQ